MVKQAQGNANRAAADEEDHSAGEFDLAGQSTAPAAQSNETEARKGGKRPPERKGVLVRMPRELWRELRLLAIDHDTTLQAIMVEAASDYVRKRNAEKG